MWIGAMASVMEATGQRQERSLPHVVQHRHADRQHIGCAVLMKLLVVRNSSTNVRVASLNAGNSVSNADSRGTDALYRLTEQHDAHCAGQRTASLFRRAALRR